MEVPRRGVNRSCSCWPMPQPHQCQILATSVTYTASHTNAGSLTHWARPGIQPESSWLLVRLVTSQVGYCWATTGTPLYFNLIHSTCICGSCYVVSRLKRVPARDFLSDFDFLAHFSFFLSFFFSFVFLRASPAACGGSLAWGPFGAVAAGLRHSHRQQCQIRTPSATYTTAHGNVRSLTHWARPGIEPPSSWFLVGCVCFCCARTGTPLAHFQCIQWSNSSFCLS